MKQSKKLQISYNKLITFEVKNGSQGTGGFDWYGRAPANESLTSYGLLEFNDMSKVYSIEQDLIPRIRNWLLSRKTGNGTFMRGEGRYGFGNAPEDITNAYICWAMTEAGEPNSTINTEIDHLLTICDTEKAKDPYYLSLVCATLYNVKRQDQYHKIAKQLITLQDPKDGCVSGGNDPTKHTTSFTSITYSWGDGLLVEATSLTLYAWMKCGDNTYREYIDKGMIWLKSRCKDGDFGATQSTIMALKAINRYNGLFEKFTSGTVQVNLNNTEIILLKITEESLKTGTVILDLTQYIKDPIKYSLELKTDTTTCAYSLSILYSILKPDNDPLCMVDLVTKLSSTQLTEGEGSEIYVSMKNLDNNNGQPMTIAIIGLPGGLEPRHSQLDELVKSGKIDFFEITGREVVIYLCEMGKGQEVIFKIDVEAKLPGYYTGPASRIYLYYTKESKRWNDQLSVTINPRL